MVFIFGCFLIFLSNIVEGGGTCSIDAATTWHGNGRTYLFKGSKYGRFKEDGSGLEYITDISRGWVGIPNDVDAAGQWGDRNYFFKGCSYWVYDKYENVYGPYDIKKNWRTPCHLDASATWGGTTYLFKGDQYWRWHGNSFSGPTRISAWNSLEANIDGGMQADWNDKTYFFKGEKYWQFESSGNRASTSSLGQWGAILDTSLFPDCCNCDRVPKGKMWQVSNIEYENDKKFTTSGRRENIFSFYTSTRGEHGVAINKQVTKTVSEETYFDRTEGSEIAVGVNFKIGGNFTSWGVPVQAEIGADFKWSQTSSFTWGQRITREEEIINTYHCPWAPHSRIDCDVWMTPRTVNLPYVITFVNTAKNACTCTSKGLLKTEITPETGVESRHTAIPHLEVNSSLSHSVKDKSILSPI